MKARHKRDAKAKKTQPEKRPPTSLEEEETRTGIIVEGARARGVLGWLRRLDWQLIALVLAIKFMLFLFAAHVFYLMSNQRLEGVYGWLQIWDRWDAPHYLDIAREGYVSTGEHRLWIVFYPLYPWLVRVAAFLTGGDYLVAAILVSALASIAAALLLHRLALLDDSDTTARLSVWFLLIFPTSYFLHIGYTESLFIAISVGCFLAARKNIWWLAGVLAALAGLTRVNGLILIPALAVEALQQWRETRRINPRWAWIAFAPTGFCLYLLINKRVAGNFFAFQTIAHEHWSKTLAPPWKGIRDVARAICGRAPAEAQMVGLQEFIFIMLVLVCTVWCFKAFRPSYGVWMALNWLLLTSTSFILSSPRYMLIMFPMYLLFARLARAYPFLGGIVTIWSLLFLAVFVTQFVQGRWAF